jgi:hypothetical protein
MADAAISTSCGFGPRASFLAPSRATAGRTIRRAPAASGSGSHRRRATARPGPARRVRRHRLEGLGQRQVVMAHPLAAGLPGAARRWPACPTLVLCGPNELETSLHEARAAREVREAQVLADVVGDARQRRAVQHRADIVQHQRVIGVSASEASTMPIRPPIEVPNQCTLSSPFGGNAGDQVTMSATYCGTRTGWGRAGARSARGPTTSGQTTRYSSLRRAPAHRSRRPRGSRRARRPARASLAGSPHSL